MTQKDEPTVTAPEVRDHGDFGMLSLDVDVIIGPTSHHATFASDSQAAGFAVTMLLNALKHYGIPRRQIIEIRFTRR